MNNLNGGPPDIIIGCPWHHFNITHPPTAPECVTLPHMIEAGRIIPLADLITWQTIILTETLNLILASPPPELLPSPQAPDQQPEP